MIKLIGIPFDGNSSFLKGPALAPPRIRLMDTDGSANSFCENGKAVINGQTYIDLGDLIFPDINPLAVYTTIKQKIEKELTQGDKIICLGGDHSVSFPIIEAHAAKYNNLNVLHLDAHADLYDNFDNNPFSHASPFARLMEKGIVQSLTQVGIRTLNTHQKEQANKFGVRVIEMKDFNYDFINSIIDICKVMYENHKFFYRVIYTHLSDDEYNEKNFRNADLSMARESALNFLARLIILSSLKPYLSR